MTSVNNSVIVIPARKYHLSSEYERIDRVKRKNQSKISKVQIEHVPNHIKRNIIKVKSEHEKEIERLKSNIHLETAFDIFNEFSEEESKKKSKDCCSNMILIPEQVDGNIVCFSCGAIKEHIIDKGAEWTNYSDSKVNPERCGKPIDPLLPKSSMSTKVEGNSRIAKRARWMQMPYEERAMWKIFNQINQRCSPYYSQRVLKQAHILFKEVKDKASSRNGCKLGLCSCEELVVSCNALKIASIASGYQNKKTEMSEFYTPAIVKDKIGIKRGAPLRSIVACCVDRASKSESSSNVLDQTTLAKIFQVDIKRLSKGKEFVTRMLDGDSVSRHKKSTVPVRITIIGLAKKMCTKLNIPNNYVQDVLKLLTDIVIKGQIMTSKASESIVAGCIYYVAVCHNFDDVLTIKKISSTCSVSTNTVTRVYEELDNAIKIAIEKIERKQRKK